MENQVIKDQTLQGCHYVIIGFRALKLLSGHIESLYFVAINARDVGKITQRTLIWSYQWDKTLKCAERRRTPNGWTDRREGGNSGLDS